MIPRDILKYLCSVEESVCETECSHPCLRNGFFGSSPSIFLYPGWQPTTLKDFSSLLFVHSGSSHSTASPCQQRSNPVLAPASRCFRHIWWRWLSDRLVSGGHPLGETATLAASRFEGSRPHSRHDICIFSLDFAKQAKTTKIYHLESNSHEIVSK